MLPGAGADSAQMQSPHPPSLQLTRSGEQHFAAIVPSHEEAEHVEAGGVGLLELGSDVAGVVQRILQQPPTIPACSGCEKGKGCLQQRPARPVPCLLAPPEPGRAPMLHHPARMQAA